MKKQFTFIALFIAVFLLLSNLSAAPQYSAERIFEKVQAQLQSVDDYSTVIDVSVDIPHLRMPDKRLNLYVKKPDLFKVETAGFAIVPKLGLNPARIDLITENTMQEIRSLPDQNDENVYIIEILPLEPTMKIETTVWVNPDRWTIDKILMNVPDAGESVVTITYQRLEGVWFPEETRVYLNMVRSIPLAQRPSVEYPVGYYGGRTGGEPMTGTIKIEFGEYRINQGLDEKLFQN